MALSEKSDGSDGMRQKVLVGLFVAMALGATGWFVFGGSGTKVDAAAAETARKLKESYGPEKPPPPLEGPPPTEPPTRGARKVQ